MDKIKQMDRYFGEYRNKCNAIDQIRSKRSGLINQVRMLDDDLAMANNELDHMRRVISLMIEKDMDPIEAQLTVDESQPILMNRPSWGAMDETINVSIDPSIGYSAPGLSTISLSSYPPSIGLADDQHI